MSEEIKKGVPLLTKAWIFITWSLITFGFVFIYCVTASFYGWATPLRTIEAMQLKVEVSDIREVVGELNERLDNRRAAK